MRLLFQLVVIAAMLALALYVAHSADRDLDELLHDDDAIDDQD